MDKNDNGSLGNFNESNEILDSGKDPREKLSAMGREAQFNLLDRCVVEPHTIGKEKNNRKTLEPFSGRAGFLCFQKKQLPS